MDMNCFALVALLLLYAVHQGQAGECVAPFEVIPESAECFYVSSQWLTWDSARAKCQSLGGDLAVPRDVKALGVYVETFLPQGNTWFYLGGNNREDPQRRLLWLNGKPVTGPWFGGKTTPNTTAPESCLLMYILATKLGELQWGTCVGNHHYSYICQIASKQTVTLFKDFMTGDEMFGDTYKYEDINDALYMVYASSEDSVGVDVIVQNHLVPTQFENVGLYMWIFHRYIRILGKKLEQNGKRDESEKLSLIKDPLSEILKDFGLLRFFTGKSISMDGMVVILGHKVIGGEEKPVLYYVKYGLEEFKQ